MDIIIGAIYLDESNNKLRVLECIQEIEYRVFCFTCHKEHLMLSADGWILYEKPQGFEEKINMYDTLEKILNETV